MISQEILDQMETVRKSGFANMFAREEVLETATRLGLTALEQWILNNKKYYLQLLKAFQGERPE